MYDECGDGTGNGSETKTKEEPGIICPGLLHRLGVIN